MEAEQEGEKTNPEVQLSQMRRKEAVAEWSQPHSLSVS